MRSFRRARDVVDRVRVHFEQRRQLPHGEETLILPQFRPHWLNKNNEMIHPISFLFFGLFFSFFGCCWVSFWVFFFSFSLIFSILNWVFFSFLSIWRDKDSTGISDDPFRVSFEIPCQPLGINALKDSISLLLGFYQDLD